MSAAVGIHDEVLTALAEGRPVVILETAVITHGLPREPVQMKPRLLSEDSEPARAARVHCFKTDQTPYEWNQANAVNIELARAMAATIRSAGGVPASTAIIDGVLRIGLEPDEIARLATEDARKCSARDLAPTIAAGESGGTTVAGTLAAMTSANRVIRATSKRTLRVLATGGIGGVHRDWAEHPDVSADIRAIASSPVLIVCAGAKVILDVPATREALDSSMVPVMGWKTDRFPKFTARGDANDQSVEQIADESQIARACLLHWDDLARNEGILLVNEIPDQLGLDPADLEERVSTAIAEARELGIKGPRLTPYLLTALAESTGGAALDSNITLLLSNAAVATTLSQAILKHEEVRSGNPG